MRWPSAKVAAPSTVVRPSPSAATISRANTVEPRDQGLRIRGAQVDVAIRWVEAEVDEGFGGDAAMPSVDLLVANAVLDLLDVPRVLPALLRRIAPSGLGWLTINFDGDSILEPELPEDELFFRVYHRSMDERRHRGRPAGDSRTGRHLFGHLVRAGAEILAAGASDWVVHPIGARYRADEAYFLAHIVHTIEEELTRHPSDIDSAALAHWTRERRQQIDQAELVYVAHQLDFLVRGR